VPEVDVLVLEFDVLDDDDWADSPPPAPAPADVSAVQMLETLKIRNREKDNLKYFLNNVTLKISVYLIEG
jgi:hypothetical protein